MEPDLFIPKEKQHKEPLSLRISPTLKASIAELAELAGLSTNLMASELLHAGVAEARRQLAELQASRAAAGSEVAL